MKALFMAKRSRSRSPKANVTSIGNHQLHPSTLMMGYGFDPILSEGALKPPVFHTSTFVFESAAAGKRFFEQATGMRPGGPEGLIYSRFNGPDQEILEDRLSVWEGAEEALTFSSGMAAIVTAMLSLVRAGDVVVHSAPLYAATEIFIAKVLSRFGVKFIDFPADASADAIRAVMEAANAMGRVAFVFLESPANPTNLLIDIEAVAAARDAVFADARPPILIDNTFLGPLWQQPLNHGADLTVYSLTKYVGGHSDLVAGGIVGSKTLLDPIRAMRNTIGTIVDPHTAWMLLRSLETLELRMARAGENAAKVCAFLADQPEVERIGYLGFLAPESSQGNIYARHCSGAGSTFSLYLKGGEAEAYRFLDALQIAKLAVSLGGTETLASHPASMTHIAIADARKVMLGITENLVRISVGIEHADDLIADFAQALLAIGTMD